VVRPALEDLAVAALWGGGCLGVRVLTSGEPPRLTLDAYYPSAAGVRRLRTRLRHALRLAGLSGRAALRLGTARDGRWVEKWQRSLRPMSIGRFLVLPQGCRAPERRRMRLVLRVRFGQAFGTGEHASTRLCVRLLERHLRPGQSFADLGTGSGILAMAACRLGASRVVAIDNDEVALSVMRRNLHDNGLTRRVVMLRADASRVIGSGPFDVVVVNIGAATIARILPALISALAPGGRCILAGILVSDEVDLLRAARRHRLGLIDRRRTRPWSALVLRREANATRPAS
jgi:ribosomal protein L11 methyltransferase